MRVRFAPSPTGFLHIGGARTALYNWLLARGQGGEFVLRIEDTDRERSTPENVEQILDALRWLELDWDEGPFSQAERAPQHTAAIEQLLAGGHAYEDEGAVRLRVPDEGETIFHDQIRGEIATPNQAIDDFVIRRSDGSSLYNLAVAVDDRDMGITLVVRGEDHISNTPRQVMILRALGAEPPAYAHLPLLHGPDGKKLSKRHGAASVQELRDAGYLPEAVRNYIALLGWGYDESTTFFTTEELIRRLRPVARLAQPGRVRRAEAALDERPLPARAVGRGPEARLERFTGRELPTEAVEISQDKMQTLADFWPLAGFLVERREFEPKAWDKVMRDGAADRLQAAREALEQAGGFDVEDGRAGAARRGRAPRRQAQGGLPARASGDRGHHGLAGDLRVGGGARPRRDPGPDRFRARKGLWRLIGGPQAFARACR